MKKLTRSFAGIPPLLAQSISNERIHIGHQHSIRADIGGWPKAAKCVLEFIPVQINNDHTRKVHMMTRHWSRKEKQQGTSR